MNLLCRIIGHHRSIGRAKFNVADQRWESICRNCRQPMVRTGHHEWRLASDDEALGEPR